MAVITIPETQANIAVLPSAARTTDTTSDQFIVGRARGLVVVIDITAGTTLSIVFNIRAVYPVSGKTAVLLASTSQTGVGTTTLRIHPELTASANLIAKDMCPGVFEVFADVSNANSATYSVEAIVTL